MEAFQRCQTSIAKQKFWKALKWHQVSEPFTFSEDIRERGSEMPGVCELAQKLATFLHRRSIKLAGADFALYSKTFFALMFFLIFCQPCVSQTFLAEKLNDFFRFLCCYLDLPTASWGLDTWGADEKTWQTLWAGWSRCWPRCCIFDQSSLYFGEGKCLQTSGNAKARFLNLMIGRFLSLFCFDIGSPTAARI